jgi:hypothetical protein
MAASAKPGPVDHEPEVWITLSWMRGSLPRFTAVALIELIGKGPKPDLVLAGHKHRVTGGKRR